MTFLALHWSIGLITAVVGVALSFPVLIETPLNNQQIASFTPYTHYAAAAYCNPAQTFSWSCGAHCLANPTFIPIAAGGDGDVTQYWYVGYDPTIETVIVAHEGTDPHQHTSVGIDLGALLQPLNPTLFPGVDSNLLVHAGFSNEQAATAPTILNYVQMAISSHSATTVTVVGHSLGAAIALLDSLYLKIQLPSVKVITITYGMPRVGEVGFAVYVGDYLEISRINNKRDPVPTLPPTPFPFGAYSQPVGEIHINDTGQWISCAGLEDSSDQCTDASADLINGWGDHLGPYNGVVMGC